MDGVADKLGDSLTCLEYNIRLCSKHTLMENEMNTADLSKEDKKVLLESTEKLTLDILAHATGPMLAAGMSESAVVKMCENVSVQYHERMLNRFEAELKDG